MNLSKLNEQKNYYQSNKDILPDSVIDNYNKAFEIDYTHNSTAIEGNTLTLMETKLVLEDKLSIGGKELREIYEVVNHDKAFSYVKDCVSKDEALSETVIKNIHALLMENIIPGGIYRSIDVYISGARHTPPTPNDAYRQIKDFYADLSIKANDNPIELAAWTHAEFVRIHPFIDGNGRTSRLIMNFQLMAHGFLPVSIPKESRLEYFNTLESYAVDNDLHPFTDLIAGLEEVQLNRFNQAIEQLQAHENEMTMKLE